ncbi:TNT domain-containing protein [Curtobacterium flaccumfaciens]|uniref:TNT domain-containing protein n=1 Tax=Curtobacterium poinsettiae TaxID=159612 RepID=A0A9Q9P7T5_9MICO|nr:TNT domain-containing protein [Curtobacterium flaccumfaciens]UXN25439.1 TNT domain-containing protein [Curtobacterium flaccumfaciens]UYC80277.1 TNT domain-containing protein [Curtobacterium flaccumfaciens pv. poinsettiae]
MTFEQLRAALDNRGHSPEQVLLPDERPVGPPVEGALRVVQIGERFEVHCTDYGRARLVAASPDFDGIARSLLSFLDRPLPPVLAMTSAEVAAIETRLAPYYPKLREQITARGGASLIQLPPGILLDRIGALDGWLLTELNSSFESRSLPPTALREPSGVHQFVTEATVLVQASIVPSWFGQPGGSVRYAIADESVTIRDLIVDGSLRRVSVPVGAR